MSLLDMAAFIDTPPFIDMPLMDAIRGFLCDWAPVGLTAAAVAVGSRSKEVACRFIWLLMREARMGEDTTLVLRGRDVCGEK